MEAVMVLSMDSVMAKNLVLMMDLLMDLLMVSTKDSMMVLY